jgi:hypothetical protein
VSFTTVWNQMSATCRACHGFTDNEMAAYNFAFARSANNNLNSLFYRKPTGGCTPASSCAGATPPATANPTGHSGGVQWAAGSAGEIAVRNWINGGRGAP